MKNKLTGAWVKDDYKGGLDSTLRDPRRDSRKSRRHGNFQIVMGEVLLPQPEPIYLQNRVTVNISKGGTIYSVAWPGPNVQATPLGLPGPIVLQPHGFYQAPLPGHQVALAFVQGDTADPIVLQTYPYNAGTNPLTTFNFYYPIITKGHAPTDVFMGHFMGSYISLASVLPVPGAVDIRAITLFNAFATAGFVFTTPAAYTILPAGAFTVTAGGAVNMSAGGAVSITGGGTLTLSGGGAATISAGATMGITAAGNMTLTAAAIVIPPAVATVTIGTGTQPVLKGTLTLAEHTKLTALLTALMAIIQGAPIPEAGNGAPSAFQTALAAATAATPTPTYTAALLSARLLAD